MHTLLSGESYRVQPPDSQALDHTVGALLAETKIGVIITDQALIVTEISAAAQRWFATGGVGSTGQPLLTLIPALVASEPELHALLAGYTDRFELMRLTTDASGTNPPRLLAFTRREPSGAPSGLLLALSKASANTSG